MNTKEQTANEFKKKYPVGSQINLPFATKNGEVTPDTKFKIICFEKDDE